MSAKMCLAVGNILPKNQKKKKNVNKWVIIEERVKISTFDKMASSQKKFFFF